MCFFRYNLDGRRIHILSSLRTLFDVYSVVEKSTLFPHTFIGVILPVEKSSLFPRTFFQCNLSGGIMHIVFTYFFQCNFDGQKFEIVFGKLEANKNIRGGFSCVCNFKQLTFARFFSLNFSNKCPWCSPVSLKFESYNLCHCKKSCCKLVFLVFTEQLFYQIILGGYIAMELLL